MNPLTRTLVALASGAALFLLMLRLAPTHNMRPYYSEIPLAPTAKGLEVEINVEGHPAKVHVDLRQTNTWLCDAPHDLRDEDRKEEPRPGYYAANHRWPQMEAHLALGSYARSLPVAQMLRVTQTGAPPPPNGCVGILGSGVFLPIDPTESPRVTLDVRAKKMILFWRPDRPKMQAGPDDVVLPYKDDTVSLSIGGRAPMKFAIDLSAPKTYLSATLAKSFGRPSKHPFNTFTPLLRGKPLSLLIGKRVWMIAAIPYPWDINILGNDVLQNYRITIDYRDNMILFEPYSAIPGEQRAVPGKSQQA